MITNIQENVKFVFVSHSVMNDKHSTVEKAVYKGGLIYRVSTTPYQNGVSIGKRKVLYYVYSKLYPSLNDAMKALD